MTFSYGFTSYLVQCILVISLCVISSVCILLTTTAGRKLLKKINDFSRYHPFRFLLSFSFFVVFVSWAGTKPPGPVIVEKGIKLTKCEQTPQKVIFEWESDDSRIAPGSVYKIQEYDRDGLTWINIGSTTNNVFEFPKFTVHKNHKWRIAVNVTEGE